MPFETAPGIHELRDEKIGRATAYWVQPFEPRTRAPNGPSAAARRGRSGDSASGCALFGRARRRPAAETRSGSQEFAGQHGTRATE